jgi:signal transduction histidine kinase
MYDITDQKLLEIELSDVYKNMSKKVAETVNTQRRQENLLIQQSKMAAMGEMVAAIAHQWRQPLNLVSLVVQDFAEMFDNPDTTQEDISDTIYLCMNQINYMSQTINDFQNYLKPSNTEGRFDINETVQATIKLLGDKHLRENILTTLELVDTPLLVTGLENEFKQVLLIILNNAMDAISEKEESGEVVIRTLQTDDGRVQVRVEDSAGGIPEGIIGKVFDNYFTTKKENGTGLGLYMAKNIVEEHMDGLITVTNGERGASFSITLPMATGSLRGQ